MRGQAPPPSCLAAGELSSSSVAGEVGWAARAQALLACCAAAGTSSSSRSSSKTRWLPASPASLACTDGDEDEVDGKKEDDR